MDKLTTASYNVAIGAQAMNDTTTSQYNVAVGKGALYSLNGANGNNVAVGYQALSAVTTGYSNTAVGYTAGDHTTTGYANVAVGLNADHGGVTYHHEQVYGCDGTGKGNNTAYFHASSGCYQQNNSSSWSTTSDERIKKNITDNTVGLSVIDKLKVKNFEYKTKDEIDYSAFDTGAVKESIYVNKTGTQIGIIAQELETVCPDCVITQSTGVKTVDTDELFWHMINAVKELSAKNEALEARLAALES